LIPCYKSFFHKVVAPNSMLLTSVVGSCELALGVLILSQGIISLLRRPFDTPVLNRHRRAASSLAELGSVVRPPRPGLP
jgi:hypothetical protein